MSPEWNREGGNLRLRIALLHHPTLPVVSSAAWDSLLWCKMLSPPFSLSLSPTLLHSLSGHVHTLRWRWYEWNDLNNYFVLYSWRGTALESGRHTDSYIFFFCPLSVLTFCYQGDVYLSFDIGGFSLQFNKFLLACMKRKTSVTCFIVSEWGKSNRELSVYSGAAPRCDCWVSTGQGVPQKSKLAHPSCSYVVKERLNSLYGSMQTTKRITVVWLLFNLCQGGYV